MSMHRRRTLVSALVVLAAGWGIALGGYLWARHSKITAEKVASYMRRVDLDRLSGEARARALRELAGQMNALGLEERRQARLEGEWPRWFEAMTEEEKGAFIEATMPTGFKQMLNAFEQLPEDRRRMAVERSLREMEKRRREAEEGGWAPPPGEAGRSGQLSPELQQKVVTIGLKSFYSESSAQTKAELAPLLEEMQRLMESGALFRGMRR